MLTGKEDLLRALIDAYLMEKGTKEFYAKAAAKSTTPDVRKTFEGLSEWEQKHMEYIQSLYQSITEDRDVKGFEEFSKRTGSPETEGGIPVKELEAKLEQYDFMDETGAISIALQVEGKAYNLYWKLFKVANDTNAREVFKSMMEQEVKHIDYIKNMMLKLSGK